MNRIEIEQARLIRRLYDDNYTENDISLIINMPLEEVNSILNSNRIFIAEIFGEIEDDIRNNPNSPWKRV